MTVQESAHTAARDAGPAWSAARWLSNAHHYELPPVVVAATRAALIDWFACVVAGMNEPVTRLVIQRMQRYASGGCVPLLAGGTSSAPFAALVHATAAHALDFDDTHIWSDAHFGGPTWAAVSTFVRIDEGDVGDEKLCLAYATGLQVGAKLGGRRLGHAMAQRGLQATGLLGRISAAAACAVLARFDAGRTAMALTLAATQTSGLTASFGTMTKPFQGGKAAFDAVLAADLAGDGFVASPAIFDEGGGLARALVQDGHAQIAEPDLDGGWEVLRNSTKAYPCLHGIHPTIDAAREVSLRIAGRGIATVRAFVAPGVPKIGRYIEPRDSHEAKFSIPYCTALGLLGRRVTLRDFTDDAVFAPEVKALLAKIEIVPCADRKMYNSAVEVTLSTGEVLTADVPMARGHPDRPLSDAELDAKFMDSAHPRLGTRTQELLDLLRRFPAEDTVARAFEIVRARQ